MAARRAAPTLPPTVCVVSKDTANNSDSGKEIPRLPKVNYQLFNICQSEGDILPQATRETRTKAGVHPSCVRPLTIEYKMVLLLGELRGGFELIAICVRVWCPIGLRDARQYR